MQAGINTFAVAILILGLLGPFFTGLFPPSSEELTTIIRDSVTIGYTFTVFGASVIIHLIARQRLTFLEE